MIVEPAINNENSEIIKVFERNDLTLRLTVSCPKFPTKKLNQLMIYYQKPFLKPIKISIRNSLDFLIKCFRDEDTEIVTFEIINLYTVISHNFVTKYEEDLHSIFTKEFVLELANQNHLKTTR